MKHRHADRSANRYRSDLTRLLGVVSQLYTGTLVALLILREDLHVPILIAATVYALVVAGWLLIMLPGQR